jgi:predicted flap endonuclease-1-like 5' DNA nuclease
MAEQDESQNWRRRFEDLDGASREQYRVRDAEIERLRAELDAARAAVLAAPVAPAPTSTGSARRATTRPRSAAKRSRTPARRKPLARRAAKRAARQPPKDDLKRIHGVGPKLERFLNRRGIRLFSQVASWDGGDIHRFEAELPEFKGRIQRENWVQSARAEYLKKYGREPS